MLMVKLTRKFTMMMIMMTTTLLTV